MVEKTKLALSRAKMALRAFVTGATGADDGAWLKLACGLEAEACQQSSWRTGARGEAKAAKNRGLAPSTRVGR